MGAGPSVAGAICDRCPATDIAGRTRWNPLVNAETDDPRANAFVGKCPIGSHFWWVYQYSMVVDSMYVFHEYAYTARKDYKYIKYYIDYMELVLRQYYQDLSDTINYHPIGYILADLENLKNPEYDELVDQGSEGNSANAKIGAIVSNFSNTKPYPPPGVLCITGFTMKNCVCAFDGQSMWWAGRYYKYGCAGSFCANDDHHLCG
jgi:hypothetical protein